MLAPILSALDVLLNTLGLKSCHKKSYLLGAYCVSFTNTLAKGHSFANRVSWGFNTTSQVRRLKLR